MRYTIKALRDGLETSANASSEANALDIIDDLVAANYAVTDIIDETGVRTPPMELLRRLMEQGQEPLRH